MVILVSVIVALVLVVLLFMQQASFGKAATGERLSRILQSSTYKDGKFQNQSYTPDLAEDVSIFKVLNDVLFNRSIRNKPAGKLPSQKTNLLTIDPEKDVIIWFGHSSCLMQIDGKKILVDPVFCGHASPFTFMMKSFKGSDVYTAEEMPAIDYLIITHDHWDHLDYQTVNKLKPKVGKVITSLGTGAHLESWGFKPDHIIEKDWNEQADLGDGFLVTATPGRHFSGRGFQRNQAMWASFVLQTPSKKIFIGGDSGYDTHFAKIGNEHGPFDLALLECGQYNNAWRYIHMMPEQTVQAAIDLKAKVLMPVHWAKFALALHAWDEPIERVAKEAHRLNRRIIHPMIGEEVNLNETVATVEWWKGIEPSN
ncbi:MAG TPA: MBL fold metallo-hydrolase [Prolixibacteraceae bacterium]|jgi:L-ascorbate metabolism protein UlaG (beta-lactamase superfamily)|nr:MBL fold metallo-hydrolase [Prolixibacteraceae bacterium]